MSGEIPSPEFLSRKLQEQDLLDRKKRIKYTPRKTLRTPEEIATLKASIIEGLSQGKTYKQIATELGVPHKKLEAFAISRGINAR